MIVKPSCDGDDIWIVTGSRYSVYDKIGWIESFNEHIKNVRTGIRHRLEDNKLYKFIIYDLLNSNRYDL